MSLGRQGRQTTNESWPARTRRGHGGPEPDQLPQSWPYGAHARGAGRKDRIKCKGDPMAMESGAAMGMIAILIVVVPHVLP
jgi:hypothetical protein